MRSSTALGVLLTGCHLIGGAGELEFDDGAPGGGGAGAQGGAAGASGGAGGMSCADVCTGECQACDAADVCVPLALGEACSGGVCDGAGVCATGEPLWSRLFGDDLSSVGADVTVSGSAVTVVGQYLGGGEGFDFDGHTIITAANTGDAFVAQLDRDTGLAGWAHSMGDAGSPQRFTAAAADGDGNVIVAGDFQGAIDHSGWAGWGSPGEMLQRVFVGKLGPDGDGLWSYSSVTSDSAAALAAVAVAADGSIAVGGHLDGKSGNGHLQLDGSTVLTTESLSQPNAIVFMLEPDEGMAERGEVRWGTVVTCAETTHVTGVAFDDQGSLWAVGDYNYNVFSHPIPNLQHPDTTWGFAIKLDPVDGTADPSSRGIGEDQGAQVFVTAVAAVAGGVVLAGTFAGTLDLLDGIAAETSEGAESDAFVAELALDGQARWLKVFPRTGTLLAVRDLAVDAGGNIALIGTLHGTLTVPGAPEPTLSAADPQVFVVKLAPGGTPIWGRLFGVSGVDAGTGIAAGAGGALFFTGIGAGPLPPSRDPLGGTEDIIALKLAP
jgi:hypothetical protein